MGREVSVADRAQQAARTRGAILDAAQVTFAARGYAGTTMRQLAESAGVSQALLHHHFGTKRALHDAVRERLLGALPLAALLEGAPMDAGALALGMRSLVTFFAENPDIIRLAEWERLEGDGGPPAGEVLAYRAALAWLVRAQEAGLVRADLDPELLLVLVGDAFFGWVRSRARYATTFGWDAERLARNDDAMVAHLVGVLIRGAGTAGGDAP